MPSPSESDAAEILLDGWRQALAEALERQQHEWQREWQRERELIQAQASAIIARLEAEVMKLRSEATQHINEQLSLERLSRLVKDGKDGIDGKDGAPGDQGPAGAAGERGDQGLAGERGEPGERGETGAAGEQGLQGERGAQGERGEAGAAGERGEQGLPGEQGSQGARGEQGERGEDGKQGEKGEKGEAGPQGEKGLAGEPGIAGDQGQPGERGAQGEQGERGEDGATGKDGAPGQIAAVEAFVEGAVHYEGIVVLHMGSTYQARCDTARTPPHDDWALIAAKGRDAAMPKIIGTYREGESYSFLNIVALNGSSFIARTDDPGPCPGEGWQLIASAGRPGKQGPKGERGEAGLRGERGLPAPAILGWKIDRASYTATPIMADNSDVEPLQLRPFFEQFDGEAR